MAKITYTTWRDAPGVELDQRESGMLKRRILTLAVAAATIASVAGLTTLGATAASAALAQRATTSVASRMASPDVITDGFIRNQGDGDYLTTNGHNNPVIQTLIRKSRISQIDCRAGVIFPNGTSHNVCLLENESGLCLDAAGASSANIVVYAESCQVGDGQEYWWAESTSSANVYWFINFGWSTSSFYAYMVQQYPNVGVQVGGGNGLDAEWHYS